jgi:hypothetical protein
MTAPTDDRRLDALIAIWSADIVGANDFDEAQEIAAALRELKSLRRELAAVEHSRDSFHDAYRHIQSGEDNIELRPDDRYDDKSILDELVASNAAVHLERMEDHKYCLIVEDQKRRVMVSIGTPERNKRKVNAVVYADEPQDAALAQQPGNQ